MSKIIQIGITKFNNKDIESEVDEGLKIDEKGFNLNNDLDNIIETEEE